MFLDNKLDHRWVSESRGVSKFIYFICSNLSQNASHNLTGASLWKARYNLKWQLQIISLPLNNRVYIKSLKLVLKLRQTYKESFRDGKPTNLLAYELLQVLDDVFFRVSYSIFLYHKGIDPWGRREEGVSDREYSIVMNSPSPNVSCGNPTTAVSATL